MGLPHPLSGKASVHPNDMGLRRPPPPPPEQLEEHDVQANAKDLDHFENVDFDDEIRRNSGQHYFRKNRQLQLPPANPAWPFDYGNRHEPPKRFDYASLFVKLLMVLYVVGSLVVVFFAIPPFLVDMEWKPEIKRIQKHIEVAFRAQQNRTDFANKMSEVFNQTSASWDTIHLLTEEFVEDVYEAVLKEKDGDVGYLQTESVEAAWGDINARELLISAITLTATSPMQCSTDVCKFVVVLTTIFTLIPVTLLLVSMSCGCLAVLTWIWNKAMCFEKAGDPETLAYKRKKVVREVCIALTTFAMLAAAMALAMVLVHADQPKWNWSHAALYVFSQATTLGRTQVIPDQMAMNKNTAASQLFYTAITVWCLHYTALFSTACVRLILAFDAMNTASLDDDDWVDVFKGDRVLRARLEQADKGPKYIAE